MGLIVRTAGMSRTKPEIKRDFDYLARVWDEIREKTLASVAPALIHWWMKQSRAGMGVRISCRKIVMSSRRWVRPLSACRRR
jgi:hypothetical protein